MTITDDRSKPLPGRGPVSRLTHLLAALVGLLLGLAGTVVVVRQQDRQDRVIDRFSGTIAKYSTSRQGICIQVQGRAQLLCGQPYLQPGQGDVREGDHVTVLVTRMRNQSGNPDDLYVVVRPPLPN